jgi:hypothetical protein
MEKGFVADKYGNIKSSWVWVNPLLPCPHPSILSDGDSVYIDTDTDTEEFRESFLARLDERLVTRDHLSVVSINSGRLVLDNLIKREANEII